MNGAAIRPSFGRHLGEADNPAEEAGDLATSAFDKAKGFSDTIEAFSVESILKGGIVASFAVVLVPVGVFLLAKTLPAVIDGGLSAAGETVRALTTRPVGYVRKLSRDIRGL